MKFKDDQQVNQKLRRIKSSSQQLSLLPLINQSISVFPELRNLKINENKYFREKDLKAQKKLQKFDYPNIERKLRIQKSLNDSISRIHTERNSNNQSPQLSQCGSDIKWFLDQQKQQKLASLKSMAEGIERTIQRNIGIRKKNQITMRKEEKGQEMNDGIWDREQIGKDLFKKQEEYLERVRLQNEKIHWYKYGIKWRGSRIEDIHKGKGLRQK